MKRKPKTKRTNNHTHICVSVLISKDILTVIVYLKSDPELFRTYTCMKKN